MAQLIFRGNLNAARFPLVSTFSGRTIIAPQYDQNFQKLANFSGGDQDRDIGIPQIFYMHNVMPTAEGLQSVGYFNAVPALALTATDFDSAFTIRDVDENKGLFVPAVGKNYIYNANNAAWQSINPIAPGTISANTMVTVAQIHGHTYLFYQKNECYEYDFTTNTISVVPLTALTVANINGICAAVTYLIAWDDDNTIFWSSVLTETDFTPSLATGAGSEIPNDVKGRIIVCLPIPNGFVIYTTKNAVLASYTGNIRFPWVFREIPGSAGVTTPQDVTWEANIGFHYAWTTSGLMKIEKTGAEPVFPEATDFVANRVFEDYDSSNGVLTQQNLMADLVIKLTMIGTRYLILSYGVTPIIFTHALIYDAVLKRFGKLRITHVDCFDWPEPNLFGVQTYADLLGRTYASLSPTTYAELSLQQITASKPKRSIAFLQSNGTVKILDFSLANTASQLGIHSVLFIGKFQFVRTRTLVHINTEVENVPNAVGNFSLTLLNTFDGKNFQAAFNPPIVTQNESYRSYGGKLTGLNLTLLFQGQFNLVSYLMTALAGGDR